MSAAPARPSRPSRGGAPYAREATARPLPQGTPARESTPSRHLHAVAAPEQARSLAAFAATCILIVVASLAFVLLLNTTMAKGAYERRDLKIEIASLHQERAALVSELEAHSSPSRLADAAGALGMGPAESLGFVSIVDGAVLEQGGR